MFRLWSVRTVGRRGGDVDKLALGVLVVSGQMGVQFRTFGGEVVVKRGYYINLVVQQGDTPPPTSGHKGGYACPLRRRGAVWPDDVPKQK